MTIIVGVACPEGLVIAADSRSSITSSDKFRIVTDHAKKLFAIGASGLSSDPFVVATYGWSMLEGITIAGHMDDLCDEISSQPPATPSEAAQDLADFFEPKVQDQLALIKQATGETLQPGNIVPFGFLVGGYDGNRAGGFVDVQFGPKAQMTEHAGPTFLWRGEAFPFIRVIKGWDARLDTSKLTPEQLLQLAGLEYNINVSGFALQDAVDFSNWGVRSTIEAQRFSDGIAAAPGDLPTCGGAVNVAVVERSGGGVYWLQRAELRGDMIKIRAEGARE